MSRTISRLGRPLLVLTVAATLLTGCFDTVRIVEKSRYLERIGERTLSKPPTSRVRRFTEKDIKQALVGDWITIERTDTGNLFVVPSERCAHVVAIDNHVKEQVRYEGGWKGNTALWTYLLGIPATVYSGVELGLSTSAPSADLVEGNPNISASYTQEDKLLSGAIWGSVGLALIATGSIALGIEQVVHEESVDAATQTVLRPAECNEGYAIPFQIGVEHVVVNAQPNIVIAFAPNSVNQLQRVNTTVTRETVSALLTSALDIEIDTQVELAGLDTSFPVTRMVRWGYDTGRQGRIAFVRTLLQEGVQVNTSRDVRVSIQNDSVRLEADAVALLGTRSDPVGRSLDKGWRNEVVVTKNDQLLSAKPRLPSLVLALSGQSLRGEKTVHKETGILTWRVEIDFKTWAERLSTWRTARSVETLSSGEKTVSWAFSQTQQQAWTDALVTEMTRRLKAVRAWPALTPEATTMEEIAALKSEPGEVATLRMTRTQPHIAHVLETLCGPSQTHSKSTGCKAMETAWNKARKAYRDRLKRDYKKAVEVFAKSLFAKGNYEDLVAAFPTHYLAAKARKEITQTEYIAAIESVLGEGRMRGVGDGSTPLPGPHCDFPTNDDYSSQSWTEVDERGRCPKSFVKRSTGEGVGCLRHGNQTVRDEDEDGRPLKHLQANCHDGLIHGKLSMWEHGVSYAEGVLTGTLRTDVTYSMGVPKSAFTTVVESLTVTPQEEKPRRSDYDSERDYREARNSYDDAKRGAMKLRELLLNKTVDVACFGDITLRDEDGKVSGRKFTKLWEAGIEGDDNSWLPAATKPQRRNYDEADALMMELHAYEMDQKDLVAYASALRTAAGSCPRVTEQICRIEEWDSDSETSCSKTGHCFPQATGEDELQCVPGTNTHCQQSNACLAWGECTLNKEEGVCEARSSRDCARTEACESDGLCRWDHREAVCDEGGRPDPNRGGTCRALAECACELLSNVYESREDYSAGLANMCRSASERARTGSTSCGSEMKSVRRTAQRLADRYELSIPSACY